MDKIDEVASVPPHMQRLIYIGKQLEMDRKLGDYGMGPKSTVWLLSRLSGS
jgi:hypothetical protein